MFEVIQYTPKINLTQFFRDALDQGFIFHTSPRIFLWPQEPVFNNWVVYQDNNPIATFGVHSLKRYNAPGYSIMSRMCVLKYNSPVKPTPGGFYEQHQNFVAQIVLPTCIKWLYKSQGTDISTYVSVDTSKPPQYMKGHNKMLQSWSKRGLMELKSDQYWHDRQVALWSFNHSLFLEQYEQCPKWDVHFPS
jgi:hypothetical protein